MVKQVAIIFKDNNKKTSDCVQQLIDEFSRRDIKVYLFHRSGVEVYPYKGDNINGYFSNIHLLDKLPDMVFSVGGDGTFLKSAMITGNTGIPIVGVNTGRMGFLANLPNENLKESLDFICNNEYNIINRTLLEIVEPINLFENYGNRALNEVAIQKSSLSMLTIHTYVNGSFLNTYWADGLIISTATGSTAYNLSVGGPILSPADESIVISPISPHNLTVRPVVLSGKLELKLKVEGRVTEYLTTCDSRSKKLSINEELTIKVSDKKLPTVVLKEQSFFNTLRNRLMWGMDKRN